VSYRKIKLTLYQNNNLFYKKIHGCWMQNTTRLSGASALDVQILPIKKQAAVSYTRKNDNHKDICAGVQKGVCVSGIC
jgi:hypothetical protein